MRTPLHAFAPFMVLSAACDDLYIGNLPAKTVEYIQTYQSIEAHKKAAEEKRRRKAEKLKRILKNETVD